MCMTPVHKHGVLNKQSSTPHHCDKLAPFMQRVSKHLQRICDTWAVPTARHKRGQAAVLFTATTLLSVMAETL